ncbi:MAG: hypothetical protein LBM96_04890 [Methanobrevibacter sp.]|jgi:hypothetical protein|nr:hypothetical protein [Candidatus Methanoflexus mossambicus]
MKKFDFNEYLKKKNENEKALGFKFFVGNDLIDIKKLYEKNLSSKEFTINVLFHQLVEKTSLENFKSNNLEYFKENIQKYSSCEPSLIKFYKNTDNPFDDFYNAVKKIIEEFDIHLQKVLDFNTYLGELSDEEVTLIFGINDIYEWAKELDAHIEELNNNGVSNERMDIINKSFDLFIIREGYYLDFIVPILVIQIDGLIFDICSRKFQPGNRNFCFIGDDNEERGHWKTFLNSNWGIDNQMDQRVKNLIEVLYTNVFPGQRFEYDVPFSRNLISHGAMLDSGTDENFLRCLYILCYLGKIINDSN